MVTVSHGLRQIRKQARGVVLFLALTIEFNACGGRLGLTAPNARRPRRASIDLRGATHTPRPSPERRHRERPQSTLRRFKRKKRVAEVCAQM